MKSLDYRKIYLRVDGNTHFTIKTAAHMMRKHCYYFTADIIKSYVYSNLVPTISYQEKRGGLFLRDKILQPILDAQTFMKLKDLADSMGISFSLLAYYICRSFAENSIIF